MLVGMLQHALTSNERNNNNKKNQEERKKKKRETKLNQLVASF